MADEKEVTVYGFYHSPFVAVVLHVLKQANIPFTLKFCSPYRKEHARSEEHQTRSPLGKVPALSHKTTNVFETQAIIRYLGRTFPSEMKQVLEGKLMDDNEVAEGQDLYLQVDELTEATNGLLQGACLFWVVVGHYAPHPKIWGWTDMTQECGVGRAWMEAMIFGTLQRLSSAFFKKQPDSPYLLGTKEPTLPDIILFHCILLIVEFGNKVLVHETIPTFDPLASFPQVAYHFEKMKETKEAKYILKNQEKERETIKHEVFEEFHKSYGEDLKPFSMFVKSRGLCSSNQ